MLHHHDKIPNIKVNLQNREKQLFKPLLRVFQNTETFEKLLPVVSIFVGEKRQARSHTLTAFLCGLISKLVKEKGATLESSIIWEKFIELLPGGELIGRLTYKTEEFDEVSQKAITAMLKDQFKAKRPKHTGNKKQLIFDISQLKLMNSKYNVDVDVKVVSESDESDESDESLVGLDRHLNGDNGSDKTNNNNNRNTNNFNISSEKSEDTDSDPSRKVSLDANNPTQATQATQRLFYNNSSETKHEHETYRRSGDYQLGCRNCGLVGDIYTFKDTSCTQSRKKEKGG